MLPSSTAKPSDACVACILQARYSSGASVNGVVVCSWMLYSMVTARFGPVLLTHTAGGK